jgi:hypothetical protein
VVAIVGDQFEKINVTAGNFRAYRTFCEVFAIQNVDAIVIGGVLSCWGLM